MMVEPVRLQAESDLGEQYLACMQLAGRYAYAGRDWVCEKVAEILGAQALDSVHNHHNFTGASDTMVAIYGLCARVLHRAFPDSAALLADLWVIYR